MDSLQTAFQNIAAWLASLFGHTGAGAGSGAGDMAANVAQAAGRLDTAQLLALAAALGWASGIRLYLVVFVTGLAGALGWLPLPGGLQVLQHPAVLIASGFMLFVEFFADKIPGVDSLWDIVHSVVRIPAGAALAAAVFGADGGTMTLVAALLGGTLAATSQAAKTSSRALINTSPEPFSNVAASLTEDGAAIGALWLATHHPLVFAVLLVFVVALMWFVIWTLAGLLRGVLRRVGRFFSDSPKVV